MSQLPPGYSYTQNIKADAGLWNSFNQLAGQVFGGLQFPAWQRGGAQMGPCYQPRAVCFGTQVVANISANLMQAVLYGRPHTLVQLGTVMVHPAHRGRGLAAGLMQRVLEEFLPQCEGMYLYANDGVRQFYPRYGFETAEELDFTLPLQGGEVPQVSLVPLSLPQAERRSLMRRLYETGNPYSAFTVQGYPQLMEFYCEGPDAANVYHLPTLGGVAVLEREGSTLVCKELYCPQTGIPLPSLLYALAKAHSAVTGQGYARVRLGFTPKDAAPFLTTPLWEEDSTLFALSGGFNPFSLRKVRTPQLTHT